MIVITGTGRCGTSVLMEFCRRSRLKVGEMIWHKGLDAGNENRHVSRINDIFRRAYLAGAKPDKELVYQRIKDLKFDVVKDPQFLVYPDILKHWFFARNDIKVIWLKRDPQAIVDSLKRHPDMNSPVFRNHVDLIVKHEEMFEKKLNQYKIPYRSFLFPDFIDDYKGIAATFRKFKKRPGSQRIWDEVMDKDMVHV